MVNHCSSFYIIVLSLWLGVITTAYSQDSIVDQDVRRNQQLWIDYNFTKSLKESKDISTQIGFRKITPEVYDRFLGISTVNFKNHSDNKFIRLIRTFHLGLGVIYTSNYNARDNLELRFIQGFKFQIPTIKPVTLYNYVRLEERFQNSFGEGWTAGYRLRYRLSTEIQWGKHLFDFTQGLYFPMEAEIFFNLKRADRFNDVIRISPGIGYKLKSGWKIESYLIFNRTKNLTETNNKSSDFILRIRIKNERNKKIMETPLNNMTIKEGQ
jgi:Protein of unknown function (DUF2490)